MKKVVSTALFGEGDKYGKYLGAFLRAHLNLYPQRDGWQLYVYYDYAIANSPYGIFLEHAQELGLLNIYYMEHADTKAMLLRMAPVFEPGVDYVFPRDLDAPPMPRDRQCMEEFMKSDAVVHTIQDHYCHLGIMGGLCGFNAPRFRESTKIESMEWLYIAANKSDDQWAKYGTDQDVLNSLCLSSDSPKLFEHRYNGWYDGPGKFDPRSADQFKHSCDYVSVPTPNYGMSQFDWHVSLGAQAEQADLIGPHLGCQGYDIEAAKKFWDEEGDPRIAAAIKECE